MRIGNTQIRFRREPAEERTLAAGDTGTSPTSWLPWSRSALLDVNTSNALRVADAYACVRVLADSVASLPLKVFRRTPSGRVPAGDASRAAQLLNRPAPGSTSADLISQIMVHCNVLGEAFVAKYRSEGSIVQLGLWHPERVEVELRGQRVIYTLSRDDGSRTEHSVEDIVHIRGMSLDGVRGLSPVAQCRLALSLSSNLQEHAKGYFERGSRPSGVLSMPAASTSEQATKLTEMWNARHGGVESMHRVAVLSGEVGFTPIAFSANDSQFLEQRELSAREIARIFRVPAWAIDAPTGDSLTYSNVTEQNRALVTHSLRPWLVRIERALSNDADLCPGGTYVAFDLDGLLRADTKERYEAYRLAREGGWLGLNEIREMEDMPPLPEETVDPAVSEEPENPPAEEEEPNV